MRQNKTKASWWLQIAACFCILMSVAPNAMAQEAASNRLITSGIGKGQAAAQRTISEIQTLKKLEDEQEANITSQEAQLAAERSDLNNTTAQIDQIEADIAVLDTDVQAVETDLATIGQHAREPISTSCTGSQKLRWSGSAWSCTPETDPDVGPHAKNDNTPPPCSTVTGKLIWTGSAWGCATDVAGQGPQGPTGADGAEGPQGDMGPSAWETSGSNVYYSSGNVGINTSNPSTPLHVAGTMRTTQHLIVGGVIVLGNSSLCDSSREGAIRFNTSTDSMSICQNGDWTNVLIGSAPPCSLPWGGIIFHTQSVSAYQTATVPFGTSCSSQTRTCTNGVLSGSYANRTCSVNPPANCSVSPWGTINHGASVTAYSASSVPCGSSCSSQTRTCYNGVLDGSFTKGSCSVAACSNCSLDGATVNHGSSRTFYQTSRACGQACTAIDQTRSCTNGSLSGSSAYSKASCPAQQPCGCNLPWGGSISNGQSVTAYQTSSVSCGSSCTSQTRSCTNGSLSGSYSNGSCSVGSCSNCSLDGATVNHGSSRTFYTSTSVPCGNSCSGGTRSCNNGSLSGSTSYNRANCSVGGCSNCSLDGATVNHGSSRTFYASSRSCGQACSAIDQSRTCNNGSLSGSGTYSKASCPAQSCASCTRPWGGTVAHGSSVTAYAASSVACGSSCTSQSRSCNNGSLSGSYTNQSCSVGSCNCNVGGSTISNGSCATRWNRSLGYSGSCNPKCLSTSVCCTNGSASPTGYTQQTCDFEPCCGGMPC